MFFFKMQFLPLRQLKYRKSHRPYFPLFKSSAFIITPSPEDDQEDIPQDPPTPDLEPTTQDQQDPQSISSLQINEPHNEPPDTIMQDPSPPHITHVSFSTPMVTAQAPPLPVGQPTVSVVLDEGTGAKKRKVGVIRKRASISVESSMADLSGSAMSLGEGLVGMFLYLSISL